MDTQNYNFIMCIYVHTHPTHICTQLLLLLMLKTKINISTSFVRGIISQFFFQNSWKNTTNINLRNVILLSTFQKPHQYPLRLLKMNLHEPGSVPSLIFIRHAGFRAADVVLISPVAPETLQGFKSREVYSPRMRMSKFISCQEFRSAWENTVCFLKSLQQNISNKHVEGLRENSLFPSILRNGSSFPLCWIRSIMAHISHWISEQRQWLCIIESKYR